MLTTLPGKPSRTPAEPPLGSNNHECGEQLKRRVDRRVDVDFMQEKLNEAITVLNKSLQVYTPLEGQQGLSDANLFSGNQHPEHERRARGSDV